jgi:hypothetical protein
VYAQAGQDADALGDERERPALLVEVFGRRDDGVPIQPPRRSVCQDERGNVTGIVHAYSPSGEEICLADLVGAVRPARRDALWARLQAHRRRERRPESRSIRRGQRDSDFLLPPERRAVGQQHFLPADESRRDAQPQLLGRRQYGDGDEA